jgi:hypothetical protein
MSNYLKQQSNKRPDFLVIANKRCGSTWLNRNLVEHPEIFMTSNDGKLIKGVHFFDKNYDKGVQLYAEYFKDVSNERRLGETEHSYFWNDLVPERIYNTLGVIPLIMTLRQPVERAYSHFQLRRRYLPKGDICYDFETAFRMAMNEGSSEVAWGYYGRQLKKYLEWFPLKTFCIIKYEQIVDKPAEAIYQVYKFLDVNSDFTSSYIAATRTPATNVPNGTCNLANKILYSSRPTIFIRRCLRRVGFKNIGLYRRFSPPPLEMPLKKKLTAEFFDTDIKLLIKLTGMDFNSWLSGSM